MNISAAASLKRRLFCFILPFWQKKAKKVDFYLNTM
jgi:hypothetical protein